MKNRKRATFMEFPVTTVEKRRKENNRCIWYVLLIVALISCMSLFWILGHRICSGSYSNRFYSEIRLFFSDDVEMDQFLELMLAALSENETNPVRLSANKFRDRSEFSISQLFTYHVYSPSLKVVNGNPSLPKNSVKILKVPDNKFSNSVLVEVRYKLNPSVCFKKVQIFGSLSKFVDENCNSSEKTTKTSRRKRSPQKLAVFPEVLTKKPESISNGRHHVFENLDNDQSVSVANHYTKSPIVQRLNVVKQNTGESNLSVASFPHAPVTTNTAFRGGNFKETDTVAKQQLSGNQRTNREYNIENTSKFSVIENHRPILNKHSQHEKTQNNTSMFNYQILPLNVKRENQVASIVINPNSKFEERVNVFDDMSANKKSVGVGHVPVDRKIKADVKVYQNKDFNQKSELSHTNDNQNISLYQWKSSGMLEFPAEQKKVQRNVRTPSEVEELSHNMHIPWILEKDSNKTTIQGYFSGLITFLLDSQELCKKCQLLSSYEKGSVTLQQLLSSIGGKSNERNSAERISRDPVPLADDVKSAKITDTKEKLQGTEQLPAGFKKSTISSLVLTEDQEKYQESIQEGTHFAKHVTKTYQTRLSKAIRSATPKLGQLAAPESILDNQGYLLRDDKRTLHEADHVSSSFKNNKTEKLESFHSGDTTDKSDIPENFSGSQYSTPGNKLQHESNTISFTSEKNMGITNAHVPTDEHHSKPWVQKDFPLFLHHRVEHGILHEIGNNFPSHEGKEMDLELSLSDGTFGETGTHVKFSVSMDPELSQHLSQETSEISTIFEKDINIAHKPVSDDNSLTKFQRKEDYILVPDYQAGEGTLHQARDESHDHQRGSVGTLVHPSDPHSNRGDDEIITINDQNVTTMHKQHSVGEHHIGFGGKGDYPQFLGRHDDQEILHETVDNSHNHTKSITKTLELFPSQIISDKSDILASFSPSSARTAYSYLQRDDNIVTTTEQDTVIINKSRSSDYPQSKPGDKEDIPLLSGHKDDLEVLHETINTSLSRAEASSETLEPSHGQFVFDKPDIQAQFLESSAHTADSNLHQNGDDIITFTERNTTITPKSRSADDGHTEPERKGGIPLHLGHQARQGILTQNVSESYNIQNDTAKNLGMLPSNATFEKPDIPISLLLPVDSQLQWEEIEILPFRKQTSTGNESFLMDDPHSQLLQKGDFSLLPDKQFDKDILPQLVEEFPSSTETLEHISKEGTFDKSGIQDQLLDSLALAPAPHSHQEDVELFKTSEGNVTGKNEPLSTNYHYTEPSRKGEFSLSSGKKFKQEILHQTVDESESHQQETTEILGQFSKRDTFDKPSIQNQFSDLIASPVSLHLHPEIAKISSAFKKNITTTNQSVSTDEFHIETPKKEGYLLVVDHQSEEREFYQPYDQSHNHQRELSGIGELHHNNLTFNKPSPQTQFLESPAHPNDPHLPHDNEYIVSIGGENMTMTQKSYSSDDHYSTSANQGDIPMLSGHQDDQEILNETVDSSHNHTKELTRTLELLPNQVIFDKPGIQAQFSESSVHTKEFHLHHNDEVVTITKSLNSNQKTTRTPEQSSKEDIFDQRGIQDLLAGALVPPTVAYSHQKIVEISDTFEKNVTSTKELVLTDAQHTEPWQRDFSFSLDEQIDQEILRKTMGKSPSPHQGTTETLKQFSKESNFHKPNSQDQLSGILTPPAVSHSYQKVVEISTTLKKDVTTTNKPVSTGDPYNELPRKVDYLLVSDHQSDEKIYQAWDQHQSHQRKSPGTLELIQNNSTFSEPNIPVEFLKSSVHQVDPHLHHNDDDIITFTEWNATITHKSHSADDHYNEPERKGGISLHSGHQSDQRILPENLREYYNIQNDTTKNLGMLPSNATFDTPDIQLSSVSPLDSQLNWEEIEIFPFRKNMSTENKTFLMYDPRREPLRKEDFPLSPYEQFEKDILPQIVGKSHSPTETLEQFSKEGTFDKSGIRDQLLDSLVLPAIPYSHQKDAEIFSTYEKGVTDTIGPVSSNDHYVEPWKKTKLPLSFSKQFMEEVLHKTGDESQSHQQETPGILGQFSKRDTFDKPNIQNQFSDLFASPVSPHLHQEVAKISSAFEKNITTTNKSVSTDDFHTETPKKEGYLLVVDHQSDEREFYQPYDQSYNHQRELSEIGELHSNNRIFSKPSPQTQFSESPARPTDPHLPHNNDYIVAIGGENITMTHKSHSSDDHYSTSANQGDIPLLSGHQDNQEILHETAGSSHNHTKALTRTLELLPSQVIFDKPGIQAQFSESLVYTKEPHLHHDDEVVPITERNTANTRKFHSSDDHQHSETESKEDIPVPSNHQNDREMVHEIVRNSHKYSKGPPRTLELLPNQVIIDKPGIQAQFLGSSAPSVAPYSHHDDDIATITELKTITSKSYSTDDHHSELETKADMLLSGDQADRKILHDPVDNAHKFTEERRRTLESLSSKVIIDKPGIQSQFSGSLAHATGPHSHHDNDDLVAVSEQNTTITHKSHSVDDHRSEPEVSGDILVLLGHEDVHKTLHKNPHEYFSLKNHTRGNLEVLPSNSTFDKSKRDTDISTFKNNEAVTSKQLLTDDLHGNPWQKGELPLFFNNQTDKDISVEIADGSHNHQQKSTGTLGQSSTENTFNKPVTQEQHSDFLVPSDVSHLHHDVEISSIFKGSGSSKDESLAVSDHQKEPLSVEDFSRFSQNSDDRVRKSADDSLRFHKSIETSKEYPIIGTSDETAVHGKFSGSLFSQKDEPKFSKNTVMPINIVQPPLTVLTHHEPPNDGKFPGSLDFQPNQQILPVSSSYGKEEPSDIQLTPTKSNLKVSGNEWQYSISTNSPSDQESPFKNIKETPNPHKRPLTIVKLEQANGNNNAPVILGQFPSSALFSGIHEKLPETGKSLAYSYEQKKHSENLEIPSEFRKGLSDATRSHPAFISHYEPASQQQLSVTPVSVDHKILPGNAMAVSIFRNNVKNIVQSPYTESSHTESATQRVQSSSMIPSGRWKLLGTAHVSSISENDTIQMSQGRPMEAYKSTSSHNPSAGSLRFHANREKFLQNSRTSVTTDQDMARVPQLQSFKGVIQGRMRQVNPNNFRHRLIPRLHRVRENHRTG